MSNDSQQPTWGSGAGKVFHVYCIVASSATSLPYSSFLATLSLSISNVHEMENRQSSRPVLNLPIPEGWKAE